MLAVAKICGTGICFVFSVSGNHFRMPVAVLAFFIVSPRESVHTI